MQCGAAYQAALPGTLGPLIPRCSMGKQFSLIRAEAHGVLARGFYRYAGVDCTDDFRRRTLH